MGHLAWSAYPCDLKALDRNGSFIVSAITKPDDRIIVSELKGPGDGFADHGPARELARHVGPNWSDPI